MLRLPLPLFIRSLYYLLNVSIIALSVCYVTIVSLQGFHCLSLYVCYVTALFYASTVPSSISYATILYLQCFQCFIICLRHCSALCFNCSFLCLPRCRHYTIS